VEGVSARLDDACFSSGRVVGLEHRGDDCALSLGLDTTGVWEQTLEGCEEGSTAWQDLAVDAEVPPGAVMEVSYRLSQDVLTPVGLPWTTLDGDTIDLQEESGRFLEVRVELHAAADGTSPELRGISVGRVCVAPR
jgi:hypothetical protein